MICQYNSSQMDTFISITKYTDSQHITSISSLELVFLFNRKDLKRFTFIPPFTDIFDLKLTYSYFFFFFFYICANLSQSLLEFEGLNLRHRFSTSLFIVVVDISFIISVTKASCLSLRVDISSWSEHWAVCSPCGFSKRFS